MCISADTVLSERATLDRSKSCNDHFGGSADHIFDEQHQSWISDRTIVLFIFAVVVCVVYEFRGIPMMAPDILTVQTATSVMGNYTFKLTFEQYSVILVCMAFFFTFLRLHEVKVIEKEYFTLQDLLLLP